MIKVAAALSVVLVFPFLAAAEHDPNVAASSLLLENDIEGARRMYESGEADVNARYEEMLTVLMHVVTVKNEGFLETSIPMLVEAGADLEAVDKGGRTALHLAAFTGNRKAVELLLRHGADPDAMAESLLTPVELARAKGHDEVVALFERVSGGP